MTGARASTLAGGGLRVEVLDIGAALRDVRLAGVDRPLLLGLADLRHYPEHSPHLGAIAGRVANRLGEGRIVVGGRTSQGDRNLGGRHMLHGGNAAFGMRRWQVTDRGADSIALELRSEAGEGGFPGALIARCVYRCTGNGQLALELTATTDAPTVVNLAPHGYFNLDGAERIDDHVLLIDAEDTTVLDADLLPTGETAVVAGELDFRTARRVGATRHDQNYCLASTRREEPRFAARLRAGGVTLEIATTEPGLQLYTGDNLRQAVPGLSGRIDAPRAGICLETQAWPDACNHPHFPSIELRPGEIYRHQTLYRFSLDA